MEIKFWKIVDGKRAWFLLRIYRWLLIGPVFSRNFYNNAPWFLAGQRCRFIGWKSRCVEPETHTNLFTVGPVAFALVAATGDQWK